MVQGPTEFTLILGSLAVIVTAVLNPEGIAGGFRLTVEQLRSKRRPRPSEVESAMPSESVVAEACVATLLTTTDMSVTFGARFDGVDIEVRPGQLVGLIGLNGAGQDDVHRRHHRVRALLLGRIDFDGTEITSMPARTSGHASASVARGNPLELFDDMTIRENLEVAAERQTWKSFLLDFVLNGPSTAMVVHYALYDIADLAGRMPNEISQGQLNPRVGGTRARRPARTLRALGRAGSRPRHRRVGRTRPPPSASSMPA